MPPKRRGRPPKNTLADEKDLNAFTGFPDTTATPQKANAGRKGKGKGKATSSRPAVPDIYREMLAEALPTQSDIPERPLKKRRTGRRESQTAVVSSAKTPDPVAEEAGEDENIEFEDVLTPKEDEDEESDEDEFKLPQKLQQTVYRDSDDESEDEDHEWEGIDFDALPGEPEASGDLELTLTKQAPATELKTTARRRKVVSRDEKVIRLQTHKMHMLCLLSHLDRRNEWVNDPETKYTLKKLLDKKTLGFLRPRTDLSQFSQTESLKKGLDQACIMWRTKFKITARGMRRALWAENDEDLENYMLPDDADTTFDKSEFREAAQKLKGSRDVGAQLFCSLLRSADVETRLVCSLQPLSFNGGGPSMPQAPKRKARPATPESDEEEETETANISAANYQFGTSSAAAMQGVPMNPRLRLGHPNATDYHMPNMTSSARLPPKPKPRPIHESPYPVFWVEVFDEAHQKWLPVDPLVTESIARPRDFEPPANDQENSMSYVIAFEEEGCARDITKRYAKAYNAKTRKNRVESTPGGDKWWRRAMRLYARGYASDADQIEDAELAAAEAREPMPKNIQDFKDHPYYALERHLRRNEVLVSTREAGKVAAGRDKNAPGGKKMESVYRRTHVKIARSADAWYRLGRDIKMGEQPVKTVAPKKRSGEDDMGDVDERPGTNLYTEDQTEPCVIPPIVNGRVPKNSFGNIDVFVPSMVPPGGVHIPHPEAQHAARIIGVDYADALTGFEFRGRHGTAVLKGVVVAAEYQEAVEAVIVGLRDEQARIEEAVRSAAVDKMWRRLLRGLRIKAYIEATYGNNDEKPKPQKYQDGVTDAESDVSEYLDDTYGGGGFLPDDDDGGGGFLPE